MGSGTFGKLVLCESPAVAAEQPRAPEDPHQSLHLLAAESAGAQKAALDLLIVSTAEVKDLNINDTLQLMELHQVFL